MKKYGVGFKKNVNNKILKWRVPGDRTRYFNIKIIMNPSRIIVGEVRGKETLDMLQAMNTGHAGSLSTGHGNSPRDMISRLETMVLMAAELPLAAIRSQIASALDVMIHLGRLRDGSRKVLSITEIGECRNGEVELEPLYEYDREKGILRKRGELTYREKLGAAGYCQRREEGKTG